MHRPTIVSHRSYCSSSATAPHRADDAGEPPTIFGVAASPEGGPGWPAQTG
ncbi:MAG: hypothetical protein IPM45_14535 [Acidimicrobiales bacterium]|nr:hypothetical protein [Acidimicrobiales bacterium]